ncbi:hypothetical protein ACIQ1H_05090 [Lysinibacillus sp. NPDC097279]|uniref:hypothetical protein n=1 Tax=Lysinibacillus sp. NPDC097279 TaxID=3364143 RepID=UPI00381D513A
MVDVLAVIKHRKAIYGALGAVETNMVLEDYDLAIERAYDIIRSLKALQANQKIDLAEIDRVIDHIRQWEVEDVQV